MNCRYCQTPIGSDGREYQSRKPLPGGDSVYLGHDHPMHHDCQREEWKNLVVGFMHLDRAVNDCRYFVRGAGKGPFATGTYERDGQVWPGTLAAHWNESENTVPAGLIEWCKERGWEWWEPRREEVYENAVRARRGLT